MAKKWILIASATILGLSGAFFVPGWFLPVCGPTPRPKTLADMDLIKSLVLDYVDLYHRVPSDLSDLTRRHRGIREGWGRKPVLTDGWGRKFVYTVNGDETVTILSYGRDGVPGGNGMDSDIVGVFPTKKKDGQWGDRRLDWLVDPWTKLIEELNRGRNIGPGPKGE